MFFDGEINGKDAEENSLDMNFGKSKIKRENDRYYELLGVKEGATKKQINAAYKAIKLGIEQSYELDPQARNSDQYQAEYDREMAELKEAFDIVLKMATEETKAKETQKKPVVVEKKEAKQKTKDFSDDDLSLTTNPLLRAENSSKLKRALEEELEAETSPKKREKLESDIKDLEESSKYVDELESAKAHALADAIPERNDFTVQKEGKIELEESYIAEPVVEKDNEIKAAQRGELQALKNLVNKNNISLLGKNGDVVIEAAKKSKNSNSIKRYVNSERKKQLKLLPVRLSRELGVNVESIKELIKNATSQEEMFEQISRYLVSNNLGKEIKTLDATIADLQFMNSYSAPPLLSQIGKLPEAKPSKESIDSEIKELEKKKDKLEAKQKESISGIVNAYFSHLPLHKAKITVDQKEEVNVSSVKTPEETVSNRTVREYLNDVEIGIRSALDAELRYNNTKDVNFKAQATQKKASVNILKTKLSEAIANSSYNDLSNSFVTNFKGLYGEDKPVVENLLSMAVRKEYNDTAQNLIKSFEKQNLSINEEASKIVNNVNSERLQLGIKENDIKLNALNEKLNRISPIFSRPSIFENGIKVSEGASAFERAYLKEFEEQIGSNGVLFFENIGRVNTKHSISIDESKLIDAMLKAKITNPVHLADKQKQVSKAMVFAIMLNNVELEKKLKTYRNSKESLGLEGQQALYSAARMKDLTEDKRMELIERLIANGANPNGEVVVDGKEVRPLAELLHQAALDGNVKFVERLAKAGVKSDEIMSVSLIEYARNQITLARAGKEISAEMKQVVKEEASIGLNNAKTLDKLKIDPNVNENLGKILIEAIVNANKYSGNAQKPYLEIIKNFGKLGVDPNKLVHGVNGEKTTAAKIAIDTKNEEIINLLKDKFKVKADFKDQSQGLSDKLVQAVLFKGSLSEVKKQFEFGIDANTPSIAKDKDGNDRTMYPLEAALIKIKNIEAAMKSPMKIEGVALENQLAVNKLLAKTQQKELNEARAIVNYLIKEKKADINLFVDKFIEEYLKNGDVDKVKYLASLGVKITENNNTSLADLAVKAYLEAPNYKSKDFEENLFLLVKNNNLDISQSNLIAEYFVDAIKDRKLDKVLKLIELGVDVNKVGKNDVTPLQAALEINNPKLIGVLMDKEASIFDLRIKYNNKTTNKPISVEQILNRRNELEYNIDSSLVLEAIDKIIKIGDDNLTKKMINQVIEDQKASPNKITEEMKYLKKIIQKEAILEKKTVSRAAGENLNTIINFEANLNSSKSFIQEEVKIEKSFFRRIIDYLFGDKSLKNESRTSVPKKQEMVNQRTDKSLESNINDIDSKLMAKAAEVAKGISAVSLSSDNSTETNHTSIKPKPNDRGIAG